MSESKDGGSRGRSSPHLEVNEDKMYESRLRGNYELHDLAHSPSRHGEQKVRFRYHRQTL